MSQPLLTARVIVSIVLQQDGKMLVLYEPDDVGNKRLNLPGGHVEIGESVLEAARREVREETGLDVAIGPLIQIISSAWEDKHTIRHTFLGEIVGGDPRPEDGSDIVWLSKADISSTEAEKFVFGVKEALLLALHKKYIDSANVILRNRGEAEMR